MSKMEQLGGKLASTLFLAAVLPAVAAAQAPNPPNAATPPPAAKAEGGQPTAPAKAEGQADVKVVHLKRADPEEVQQAINQLWPAVAAEGESTQATPMKPTAPAPAAGKPAGIAPPRVAVNSRTRTLFLRGSGKALELASEVIDALDGEPGKESPKLKNLVVFQAPGGAIDEVLQVLTTLDLNSHVFPMRKSNMLIVAQGPYARDVNEVLTKWGEAPAANKTAASKSKPQSGD